MNHVELTGELFEKEPIRFTPAGVPVFKGSLHSEGIVTEAGEKRKVITDSAFVSLGETALSLDKENLGSVLRLSGFLANQSLKSRKLIIHVTEFTKGV